MAGADGDSPLAASKRLLLRADRLLDLTPAMDRLAVEFERQTAQAFASERSPGGEDWPALAPSTVLRRARKLKSLNRRSAKTGKLTKKSRRNRERFKSYMAASRGQATASGQVFKALWDTGRLRQSINYVGRPDGIEISAVAYIRYHVTGSLKVRSRPPRRNPLVVQLNANGNGYALIPSASARFREVLTTWVNTGAKSTAAAA